MSSKRLSLAVRALVLGQLVVAPAWPQAPAPPSAPVPPTPPSEPRAPAPTPPAASPAPAPAPQPPSPPPPRPAPSAPPSGVAPAPNAPPPPSNPATLRVPSAAPASADTRHGVVRLERDGQRIGFGMVLRGDGRILTALSALGHGNFVRARFADDSVHAVRVVASSRPWDLALLVVEGAHWAQGLRPSPLDPGGAGAVLQRHQLRGGRLELVNLPLEERRALLGRDGVVLEDALVPGVRLGPEELGSPLLDARGEVVGLTIQACSPKVANRCQLESYGAPVAALKAFLKGAPPRPPRAAAWVGLRGVAEHDGATAGVRVISVEPGSPAAKAGLHAGGSNGAQDGAGDLIVAVDGVPVATADELSDAIDRAAAAPPKLADGTGAGAAPARSVRLLVYGARRFREVTLEVSPPAGASSGPAPVDGKI